MNTGYRLKGFDVGCYGMSHRSCRSWPTLAVFLPSNPLKLCHYIYIVIVICYMLYLSSNMDEGYRIAYLT